MIINYIKRFVKRIIIRKNLQTRNIKLVIGSGGFYDNGWIGTDMDVLDILKEKDWKRLFKINSIDVMIAEHVWEHLTIEEGRIAAKNCYKYLKKGGYFRLAVPDGFNPNENYINYVKPGGFGPGASDHKVLYTYHSLSAVFTSAGFKVKLLEYYNEFGIFQQVKWSITEGKILRSKENDPRNKDSSICYNSIIIDAYKV